MFGPRFFALGAARAEGAAEAGGAIATGTADAK